MAKAKSVFFCKECGYESPKWVGQCPACKAWDSMVEEPNAGKKSVNKAAASSPVKREMPEKLSAVKVQNDIRIVTGVEEFDRVLGGGIVDSSLVLVGGDPGIGKSTLLLQICRILAGMDVDVLYISGEESVGQIKMRADRLGNFKGDIELLSENNLDNIEELVIEKKPRVVVIDSIQTMFRSRKCEPGKGDHRIAPASCKGLRYHDLYRRTCHQGRRGGRPQSAGAYGGYCALF